MTTKPIIQKMLVSGYGQCGVFDTNGQQIPELQQDFVSLWCDHASKLGYEVNGLMIDVVGMQPIRIFKTDYGYNWSVMTR